jgi:hypothetical protein
MTRILLLSILLLLLGADWKPDRRPIGMIYTGPGAGGWPPSEIAKKGTFAIRDRIWKRNMWHMPASWEPGHMSGAQWFTLSRDQRSEFRKLNKLSNSLGKKFYVYGGIAMESAMSLKFSDPSNPHLNDFYSSADHYAMWELVIAPWRKDSCDGWAFDAGSHPPYQKSALAWCNWLRTEHNMWTAIEAFPLTNCPNCIINDKIALEVPAVARSDFNPSASQLIAPPGSELHVWMVAVPQGDGSWKLTMTVDEAIDWIKRGFILSPDAPHDDTAIEAYEALGMDPVAGE